MEPHFCLVAEGGFGGKGEFSKSRTGLGKYDVFLHTIPYFTHVEVYIHISICIMPQCLFWDGTVIHVFNVSWLDPIETLRIDVGENPAKKTCSKKILSWRKMILSKILPSSVD